MIRRVLSVYVNCSLGGMTSVYRARALAEPDTQFDLVFEHDKDGRSAFSDLDNVEVRIVTSGRLPNFVNWVAKRNIYDLVTICGMPDLPARLDLPEQTRLAYEIHSPLPESVRRDVERVDAARIDEIWTPSPWATELVKSCAPRRKHLTVRTVTNLVDTQRFTTDADTYAPLRRDGQIPVLWIGRLENTQKNYLDVLRVVKLLPDRYYGLMVVSLDDNPARFARSLADASMLGVEDRVDLTLNIAQQDVADLHRAVARAGGVYCSTALSETFGYGVLEAGLCGLSVAAYDVGPLSDHQLDRYALVPVGSLRGLASAIRGFAEN